MHSHRILVGSSLALIFLAVCTGAATARSADAFEEIEAAIGLAVMSSVPIYFRLQAWLAYAWKGRWRRAALIPLVAMVPAVLWSLYALSRASNLWPITVILLAPFALVYLLVLCVLRALVRRFDGAST